MTNFDIDDDLFIKLLHNCSFICLIMIFILRIISKLYKVYFGCINDEPSYKSIISGGYRGYTTPSPVNLYLWAGD